ncbi:MULTISPECIES: hypothetical protein [unclassified Streptomyces]|uniref:hypothetical protein n=1 Tax=unclassified Streptomyces TaxID=2593676 RepID=UPI0036E95C95
MHVYAIHARSGAIFARAEGWRDRLPADAAGLAQLVAGAGGGLIEAVPGWTVPEQRPARS